MSAQSPLAPCGNAACFNSILNQELILALGCTEPIAIAYAAATARDTLGCMPDRIQVECSGNIIKNVKGVVVPGTGCLKGVEPAAILGVVGGDAALKLQVLTSITAGHLEKTKSLLRNGYCQVDLIENVPNLMIIVTAFSGDDRASVEIRDAHTHITRIEKNGQVIFRDRTRVTCAEGPANDYGQMNLSDILAFCRNEDITPALPALKQQAELNNAIAHEGLSQPYGEQIGATLLRYYGDQDVKIRARALAAAGSDARMSGCVMPVVINSGSGNQGITVTMPVLAYADALDADEETRYRALALSNLISIYIKRDMGKLSAFCGAVSAACGCGAGITFLSGGTDRQIADTVKNTLADVAGIVCDGAKPSCAAKIASAVDAAILGHLMAMEGRAYGDGEGIVTADIDQTIANTARMGREGMRDTDHEILNIMLGK
ncbi:MAG: serine dehydratase subunit alpha family protein [Clostridiales bacterium]|nr:serine dehydratase subunit alpha family protein [Clostridiales bacterium]